MSYLAFDGNTRFYMIPYSINTFHDGKFYPTEYIANRAEPLSNWFPRGIADQKFYLKTWTNNRRSFFRWLGTPSDVPVLTPHIELGYTDLTEERDVISYGVYYGRGYLPTINRYVGYVYLAFDISTGTTYKVECYNLIEAGKVYDVVTSSNQLKSDGSNVYVTSAIGAVDYQREQLALNNDEYNPDLPLFPGPTSGGDDGPSGGTEGGTGTFENPNDPIGITDPSSLLGALETGLTSIYVPTLAQMQSFASALWDPNFIQLIETMFNKPLDAVLGLSIVPLTGISGSAKQVKIGRQDLTGVSMNVASSQYVQVNCGSIIIKEFFGSCLDYAPYTKISLFLPYIGIVRLNTDDVMNKTITIVYNVDILSGACLAQVKCGNAVLYQYAGSCALNIPLSSLSFTNTFQAAVNIAATTVGAVAAIATGGLSTAANVGIAAAAVASTGASVMSAKPQIQHSGSIGGTAGMLGGQVPYIIREQPKQSLAVDYNTFVGYPCNITMNLSACAGFTQVEEVHLEGMTCTADEAAEIESLLKGGVII